MQCCVVEPKLFIRFRFMLRKSFGYGSKSGSRYKAYLAIIFLYTKSSIFNAISSILAQKVVISFIDILTFDILFYVGSGTKSGSGTSFGMRSGSAKEKSSNSCGSHSGSTTGDMFCDSLFISIENKYQLVPAIFVLPLMTCCNFKCQNYLKGNVELIRVVDGDNTLMCGLVLVVEI
jgi:hypothetical protein